MLTLHPILQKMKKCLLLLLVILFWGGTTILAQVNPRSCITDLLQERLRTTHPERAVKEQQINQLIFENIRNGNVQRGGQIVIPVVVHIIHQNGSENIPDAMVLQGLQHLNEAFSNSGNYQQPTDVNTNIQFCLAQQDEQGMPTSGITRHLSELTNLNAETQDAALKSIVHWDPFNYLNIYLVNEITSTSLGSGIAGYAYYPSSHGSPEDGIVNEADLFGSSVDNSKVHIHEAGHYLGLYHTFTGGCTNANCLLDGDRICDTPPDNSADPIQCNSFTNTCTTDSDDPSVQNPFRPVSLGGQGDQPDMFVNYMDYGFQLCQHSFTQGQGDRMNAMLNGPRASLLTSEGCNNACGVVATGTNYTELNMLLGSSVELEGYKESIVPYYLQWQVNGITLGNGLTYQFTPNFTGNYIISFRIYNDELACFSEKLILVKVLCNSQITAPMASSPNPDLGETVTFTGYPNFITFQQWLVNGEPAGNSSTLSYTFSEAGENTVVYVTSNGSCSDTSEVIYIPVGSCNAGESLKWFFGNNYTMSFYGNTPVVGLLSTNSPAWANEGCSSICNQNGDLILFTNGISVFNGAGNLLGNGTDLNGGGSSAQGALIVPNPSYNGLYYIFTTDDFGGGSGLSYSIADINQDLITQKNINLTVSTTERQSAVKHCNGHDIWHLSHEFGTDVFYAHLVTDEGVSATPIISNVGSFGGNPMGCMKISPQGNKLAQTIYDAYGILPSFSELFDFDNETGLVSNPINLSSEPMHNYPYGVEFSPNGSKLYISNSSFSEPAYIFQYDLSSGNPAEIVASKQNIANTNAGGNGNGSLQLAKNGRIYSARVADTFLDEIRQPDLAGQACEFTLKSVGGIFVAYALPNQVSSSVASVKPEIQGPIQICANSTGTYSIFCGHSGNVTWNYVGLGTFQQNDANTISITSGNGSGSGILMVTRDAGCSGLLHDTLNISIGIPEPHIGNDTLICMSGELHLSPGPGYSSYLWQGGSTMSYFDANGAGTYWVRVTGEGGCSAADTIHVDTFNESTLVSLGNDVILCPGGTATLAPIEDNFIAYSWSSGEHTPSISVNYSGQFFLEATNSNGCRAYDTIAVSINNIYPFFNFNDPQYICPGQIAVLETPFPTIEHRWQDNSDLPQFSAWQPGIYWVTVTDACGNSFTDSVHVLQGSYPVVNLGNDTVACPFSPFNLDATTAGNNQYLWNNGTLLPVLQVNTSGNYIVIVTNVQGCSRSDSIKVEVCPAGIDVFDGGNTVAVYPNPANEYLRIEGGNDEKLFIRFYTISGQLLIEKEIDAGGEAVISTAAFAAGLHFLEVRKGNKLYHEKVMVSH